MMMLGFENADDAAQQNEIEVSVFGPGVGESVVLHCGYGRWLVIDSCRNNAGAAVPLEYLRSIGVDVNGDVSDVIATPCA